VGIGRHRHSTDQIDSWGSRLSAIASFSRHCELNYVYLVGRYLLLLSSATALNARQASHTSTALIKNQEKGKRRTGIKREERPINLRVTRTKATISEVHKAVSPGISTERYGTISSDGWTEEVRALGTQEEIGSQSSRIRRS
jgi:hypothetical protein